MRIIGMNRRGTQETQPPLDIRCAQHALRCHLLADVAHLRYRPLNSLRLAKSRGATLASPRFFNSSSIVIWDYLPSYRGPVQACSESRLNEYSLLVMQVGKYPWRLLIMSQASLWSTVSDTSRTRLTADSVPAYEYIFSIAAENLDNEAVLVLQDIGSERDAQLVPITWRQLSAAIHSRAAELVRLIGLPPRALGEKPFVVGLLGNNGYQYLVTWLALFVLRWTVSRTSCGDA